MNTIDAFKNWHRDLSEQLTLFQKMLNLALAEHALAVDEVRVAEEAYRQAQTVIVSIDRPSALITDRLSIFESACKRARGHQASAAGEIKSHRNVILEVELALRQLKPIVGATTEDAA